MPAAEMISGTIMGEIRMAMIARRNGTCCWLRPMAARVPKLTDRRVAAGAILIEFQTAPCHAELLKKSL